MIFFLEDVEFPSSEVGYIIGRPTIIFKTENYDNSWYQVLQDTTAEFVELEFISADTGWIIGNFSNQGEIIKRTYDGGKTWNYYYPDALYLTDIQMLNSSIGYITHWGGVLKTSDGGDTWVEVNENIGGPISCCSFLDPDFGYIGMEGGVARTENGGQDWTFISSQTLVGGLGRSQLQFINADTGYYAGHDAMASVGVLARTTNGGYEWEETRGKYYDIDMYDNDTGYCIKYTGEIYKTTEGGILVGTSEYNNAHSITIGPTPFHNELYINIVGSQISNRLPIVFELFDINGNKVYSKNIETRNVVIHSLNSLQSGSYLYLIKSETFVLKS